MGKLTNLIKYMIKVYNIRGSIEVASIVDKM